MNWLKKIIAAKISINIVLPSDLIKENPAIMKTSEPRIINVTTPASKPRKSNVRFIQEDKLNPITNETRAIYYTECYNNGRWEYMLDSLTSDKDKAMDLHLFIINNGTLKEKSTVSVLWEGLDKDETKSWVALNSTKSAN